MPVCGVFEFISRQSRSLALGSLEVCPQQLLRSLIPDLPLFGTE